SAPHFELRPNSLRAFLHSLQPPMIGSTSVFDNLRIETTAVVSDSQSKLPRVVGDFDLNVKSLGMCKCIHDGLAPNVKCFLSHHRVQQTVSPLHYRFESNWATLSTFFRHFLERSG